MSGARERYGLLDHRPRALVHNLYTATPSKIPQGISHGALRASSLRVLFKRVRTRHKPQLSSIPAAVCSSESLRGTNTKIRTTTPMAVKELSFENEARKSLLAGVE